MLTEAAVRAVLAEVPYPGLKRDIIGLGLVRSVAVHNDRVQVSLALSSPRKDVPDRLRETIRRRLEEAGALRSEVQILSPDHRLPARAHPTAGRDRVPRVRRVIAVGAGKGGVGKSTVAVNLALVLRDSGLRTGLLDADIYGPSIPMLVGLEDGARLVRMTAQHQILPLSAFGLAVVSFGFFLGAKSPAIWRGPMVGKAVKQFARGVVWPDLDVLIVDLPPGTGDVPLALTEAVVVDGVIVVTTPQRLSALEAGKAIEMFRKLQAPVLGLVENMSFAVCGCGRRSHPFGEGGGEMLSRALDCPLLAQVPFDESIVVGGDRGTPVVLDRPEAGTAAAFRVLAWRVREALGIEPVEAAAPEHAP